jgi:hypothetical protein
MVQYFFGELIAIQMLKIISCLSETLHLLQYPYVLRSQKSLVGTVRAQMLFATKDLSLLRNVYTGSEVPQSHIQYVAMFFPNDKRAMAFS